MPARLFSRETGAVARSHKSERVQATRGEFLALFPAGQGETAVAVTPPILFVLNWHEELKRLVPTK